MYVSGEVLVCTYPFTFLLLTNSRWVLFVCYGDHIFVCSRMWVLILMSVVVLNDDLRVFSFISVYSRKIDQYIQSE